MPFLTKEKTNWKYILIILILAVIVGGGILVYLRYFNKEISSLAKFPEIKKPEKVITEEKELKEEISCIEINESLDLTTVKEKTYPLTGKEEYWIGDGEFKVVGKIKENLLSDIRVYKKHTELMKIADYPYGSSLWCFSYNDYKYVILEGFTGGAHCCESQYIFVVTPNGELKFIRNITTELEAISLSSLVFKNGKLYIKLTDSRFEYFFGPHPSAFYVDQHFLIDGEKMILDNSEFKEEYIKKAEEKTKDCFEVKNWEEQAPILCIGELVVNYLLAGEEETAWKIAEEFFNEFPDVKDADGNKITLEEFRKEIKARLAMETLIY
jgi:hypothetical protein